MDGDASESARLHVSRRTVLGAVGATVGGAALAGAGAGARRQGREFVIQQGDTCVPVTPLSGDGPVEEFYDYRLPARFVSDDNGGFAAGEGATYSSNGTVDLQRADTSLLVLYDGPRGLSLVVVHGAIDESVNGGGSATFEFVGLPDDGEWAVKDDLYRANDGSLAPTNYDRWDLDGNTHRIDWTWRHAATDGGAFRGLDPDGSVTVDPAFNEAAELYGEHYEGTVEAWEFLSADGAGGVERHALDMTAPLTIAPAPCDGSNAAGAAAAAVHDVEFRGCGAAWVVFESEPSAPVPGRLRTSAGGQSTTDIEMAPGDMTTVPGQYGDRPVYKATGPGKVLAISIDGGDWHENDHRCAENERDRDADDADDDEAEADDDEAEATDDDDDDGDDDERGPPDHAGPPDDDEEGDEDDDGDGNGRGPPDDDDDDGEEDEDDDDDDDDDD